MCSLCAGTVHEVGTGDPDANAIRLHRDGVLGSSQTAIYGAPVWELQRNGSSVRCGIASSGAC